MSASKKLLVHLMLILSGTAALVYQVIWVRVLQYSFGNTDLAVSTVLAVFMGGLALGSFLGGRYAQRFGKPILVYGALELIIALYALGVTPLLYHMDFVFGLVGVDAGVWTLTVVRFLAATVLLFVPTVCMGATLPILTVPLVEIERTGEGVGMLYFVNTLGAVVGAAMAGFVLVRFLGLDWSLYVAVGFGLSVFAGALVLQRTLPRLLDARKKAPKDEDEDEAEAEAEEVDSADEAAAKAAALSAHAGLDVLSPRLGYILIMFAAGMCGYISLVNEVVWTRMLGFLLDGTVYGFSALLASFLLGIALGSLIITPFIDRSRDLWGLFAVVQLLAGIGCVLTILGIPMVPALADAVIGGGTAVTGGFAWKVLIVFFIVLVPCLFFGAAFPIAVTIASHYRGVVSSSMGSVYAANTVGCILGSISGGIVLLQITGDLNTILVMMVFLSLLLSISAGCASTVLAVKRFAGGLVSGRGTMYERGLGLVAFPLAVLILVGAAWPDVKIYRLVSTRYAVEDYDRSLGFKVARAEKQVEKMVFKAQGRVTVVTVHRLSDGGLRLRNNGLNEAYHGTADPRYAEVIFYLGVLPYMLHPKPERALQIGLGGGGTAECLTKTNLKKLTVVELEEQVVKASRFIYKSFKVKHPYDDPRVTARVDDGRNALLRSARARPRYYDIIVSQPSHAWLSGVASLYTTEHFGIVRKNLRKGGIFCQWINLFRMDEVGMRALMASFTKAFPSVHVFQVDTNSLLLVGGDKHLKMDPAIVQRHLKEKRLKAQAEMFSIDAYHLFRRYLFGTTTARALAKGAKANSDRYPIIEMRLPWVLHNDTVDIKKVLKREKLRWGVQPDLFVKSKGWQRFLKGMSEDLIAEYDSDKWPLKRVQSFVDDAALLIPKRGRMLQARLAQLSGDSDRAVKLYRQAAKAGQPEALYLLGSIYLTLERYAEAAESCGRSYEKTKRADARLCAAEAYFRQGRLADARGVLERMVEKKEHEEVPAVQKWLGVMDYLQGRFASAKKRLAEYLNLDSGDDLAPYYLGLMAASSGHHTKAREHFASAIANSQAVAEAASSMGKRYAKGNHQAAAVTRFREALRKQPNLAVAYKWMAAALRRWGRYSEMNKALEMFGKQDPNGASAYRIEFKDSASLAERVGTVLYSYRKELSKTP